MLRINRTAIIVLVVVSLFLLHLLFGGPPDSTISPNLAGKGGLANWKHKVGGTRNRKHKDVGGSGGIGSITSEGVVIDKRGYTEWKVGDKRHPIEMLIERGKKLAKAQEARIREVISLEDAVDEYEKAWGMKPPKFFDAWYRFTQSITPHPIPVAPLLPTAFKPILPYLSLPIDILRERIQLQKEKDMVFTLSFVKDGTGDPGTACTKEEEWFPEDGETRGKGRVVVGGGGAWSWRCNNTLMLMLPALNYLPDEFFEMDPPLEIPFGMHDGPQGSIHDSMRERSEALGRAGKVWPKAQLHKAEQAMRWTYGWGWSCPEGAPLKTQNTDLVLNDLPNQLVLGGGGKDGGKDQVIAKSFIADFDRSIDYCNNLELMTLHHVTLGERHRAMGEMQPLISICGTKWNSDIVGVALDGAWETADFVPWEKKTLAKAFWRGSATGLHHNKGEQWRLSQRERLHSFAQNTSTDLIPVLVPTGKKGVDVQRFTRKALNEFWLDAGLSGGPTQCNENDGSCDDMRKEIKFMGRVGKEESIKYKFVIDVDGNGWSSRFRRLMQGNNVVLKSTLYPEWFHEQLIPWYHYVPLKIDYTDIYDIMTFFEGSMDGSVPGRDDLAQEIAANGLKFVEERWRVEDMQSFMMLLFLEYWRMMSEDRKAASYTS